MNITRSIEEFSRANKSIPGGVNSPVRAYRSVLANPIYLSRASGSKVTDIDNNTYIDFVSSWGPLILGHAHPPVLKAIGEAASRGTSFGAPTIIESDLAELIKQMMPSIDSVRMVNSGTEATMSAQRLARGYTQREKIIKFAGCYHGHADSFLIKAGSGAITLGLPDSPGVTKGTAMDTLLAQYNDLQSVEKLFTENANEIAAVILEPVAGNMGVVLPEPGFLQGLRDLTYKNDALLIFDEVITGFRLATGGAQEYYGINPDLTTLGKIIGGGLPVGAYGGRKEIMDMLAPQGSVYQAGTLSGNPLSMAAGYTMLNELNDNPSIYDELERKADILEKGLRNNLEQTDTKAVINRIGSMMTMFFNELEHIRSLEDSMKSDTGKYASYFKLSLESGIYLAPSQFECVFVSHAHSDDDIQRAIEANLEALKIL